MQVARTTASDATCLFSIISLQTGMFTRKTFYLTHKCSFVVKQKRNEKPNPLVIGYGSVKLSVTNSD